MQNIFCPKCNKVLEKCTEFTSHFFICVDCNIDVSLHKDYFFYLTINDDMGFKLYEINNEGDVFIFVETSSEKNGFYIERAEVVTIQTHNKINSIEDAYSILNRCIDNMEFM